MDKDYTHITLVVDRSGSMTATLADAQGGIDTFLDEQFSLPGKLTLTLVEFDTQIDIPASMATERPKYTLVPRGMTALWDAVGTAITNTGMQLNEMPEDQRPVHVIFAVVTDGQENSSHIWNAKALKEKIQEQENKYNWHFVFIGQDQSAWQGGQIGMTNSVTYSSAVPDSTSKVYSNLNTGTTNLRSGMASALVVEDVEEEENYENVVQVPVDGTLD